MSPEFGSTAAIFPIDQVTLDYLRLTGRSEENIKLVEAYTKEQGLWHDPSNEVEYSEYMELDLSTVVPSISGPRRPQDRIILDDSKDQFRKDIHTLCTDDAGKGRPSRTAEVQLDDGREFELDHGKVAIASITSCTNTSNPSVMMAAAVLARNAVEKGLTAKPWVKTSVAPGSRVVTEYYEKSGLIPHLEELGFSIVGYGCTTCIGNSGPLAPEISKAVNDNDLAVTSVLSGNRNFEGRINPDVKMNYLASPPLVVAYALAGTMDFDFENEPLGQDSEGNDIMLADICQIQPKFSKSSTVPSTPKCSTRNTDDLRWRPPLAEPGYSRRFDLDWDPESTYVRKPPYFEGMTLQPDLSRTLLVRASC